ncbi:MAG: alanine racemase [Bryobacteraceae bacterium]|nr:alanine racemase [Bryobacteraceae bacterium]
MLEPAFRSWVEVSLSRIAANFRAVRDAVGPGVAVMPVVKADAYRHGAVEVSRTLEAEGAKWLAVSSVEEGVALREAGITARIVVMADFLPAEREALLEYSLTPAIHSIEGIRELDEIAAMRSRNVAYHLKIDSGMGRLGALAGAAELLEAITVARHAWLEGMMTHFASAGVYSSTQTDSQIQTFNGIRAALGRAGVEPSYVHMSSSIPIAYGRREAWGNMVRPGHAIYGYVSPVRGAAPKKIIEVKPALAWRSSILEVKQAPEGALIGYGGMFRTTRPTRIGVLAVGYADGIPHRLSNKGKVIAAGRLAPILGAVSMDLTTVDLSEAPSLRVGDSVVLLGEEGEAAIDAQQIARLAGTISYAVLCGISARVKRLYR